MKDIETQKGVTLLELVIVLAILGVLFAGIYNTFQAQQRAYVVQSEVADMNQSARFALEIMSRQIRNACYDPTMGASASIYSAGADTIIFSADLNEDGDCDDDGEWVGFRYNQDQYRIDQCSGTNCSVWNPFVDNIRSLQFSYIYADGESSADVGLPNNSDSDTTNDLEDIREVEIKIHAQPKEGWASDFERLLSSRVKVRNLALMQ
jgi:prepilin-type N-terminal cleavage/methylation domain-containing protein